MFVDEINLTVIAGRGGDGCTSFRREKYIPMGGPDGGSGGHGSNIIFRVDRNLKTLIDLKYKKIIKGDKGVNGKGSNKVGANAEDIVIKVPMGTTVTDLKTNQVVCDLIRDEEEFIVAHGGRGGRGNTAFATHENPAPKMSELGEPGEEKNLKCELKVMADIGLIGLPSVGKSTILSKISNATPKIAAYHFTTLNPNLGVVNAKGKTFVVADLPGLIEKASEGVGLGIKFLRHASRTKLLAHVIDMGGSLDPVNDYQVIRKEITNFGHNLDKKNEIVIANKKDLENFTINLAKFKKAYPDLEIISISAENNENINELIELFRKRLEDYKGEEIEVIEEVIYKFEEKEPFTITKDNNVWIITGDEIEKLFKMTRFNEEESVRRFSRRLKGMGVEEKLLEMGAIPGDEISILDYSFEFKI